MAERDNYIDFLRFIGLLLIILAHVHSPETIHQIRCFDVPLMLFVSGLAYGNKSLKTSWDGFYLPRLKRLLIPVYLFVVCDLVALYAIGKTITLENVTKSIFLCTDGLVGYVWVIKVFVLIMLVTPLLIKLNKRLNKFFFTLFVVGLFGFQELTIYLISTIDKSIPKAIFQETIPYLIGYAIPFLLGLKIRTSDKKEEMFFIILLSSITICSLVLYIYNNGLPVSITPTYKYPPRSYFIVYGLFASMLLWSLRSFLKPMTNNKVILFIGRNTIWIYLWHIVYVSLANIFLDSWIIKYFMVCLLAIITYMIQYSIIKHLAENRKTSFFKYFIG